MATVGGPHEQPRQPWPQVASTREVALNQTDDADRGPILQRDVGNRQSIAPGAPQIVCAR